MDTEVEGRKTTPTEKISIYIYHKQPPFIVDQPRLRKGLVYELEALLNTKTNKNLSFKVEDRTRARLNVELKDWIKADCPARKQGCNNRWVVFGVTPAWGWGPKADERFRWIDLFHDKDLIISLASNRVDYEGPESLKGKIFGAIRGHKYPPAIDGLFRTGDMTRQDGVQEWAVLMRLFHKRVDVTMLQQSALSYVFTHNEELSKIKDAFHVSKNPLESFILQIMVPPGREDIYDAINDVKQQSAWRTLFQKYDIVIP